MLLLADKEHPILEDCRRECRRNCVDIHEIHVIRPKCVTEVGTQPEEHVVVAWIGWAVFVGNVWLPVVEIFLAVALVRGTSAFPEIRLCRSFCILANIVDFHDRVLDIEVLVGDRLKRLQNDLGGELVDTSSLEVGVVPLVGRWAAVMARDDPEVREPAEYFRAVFGSARSC